MEHFLIRNWNYTDYADYVLDQYKCKFHTDPAALEKLF